MDVSTNRYLMQSEHTTGERAILRLYGAVVWLAQPLVRRKLYRRAVVEPEYGLLVDERFGHYEDAPSSGWIWVHAVSLGETRAAALLVSRLRALRPDLKLLLTHSTATGWVTGSALLRPGDRQAWLPWDTRGATRNFLDHFKPVLGILMETEVWPNLVDECSKTAMPLVLVNARLNRASFTAARRLSWLSRPAYANLSAVLAQTQQDAVHLGELGATVTQITGNIKFDAQPDANQLARGRQWHNAMERPVLSLMSSRESEEVSLIAALSKIDKDFLIRNVPARSLQILIVPRHPQRVAEVAAMVLAAGFSVSRRSEWQDQPMPADVWLGDSMGEMSLYYGMTDVAMLGGSFGQFGGQNLIEAAACGCPLVMGPHTYNFTQAADWAEQAGIAVRVSDMNAGLATAVEWLGRAVDLRQAGIDCLKFAETHQGASGETAAAVLHLLDSTH